MKRQLLITCALLGIATRCYAVDAVVDVTTAEDPASVLAFIIDEKGTRTLDNPKWVRTNARHIAVTIPVGENVSKYTAVSAMATSPSGIVSISEVADKSQFDDGALFSLPQCAPKELVNADASQIGLLQSLVDVRLARRSFLQGKVKSIMSGAFLEKLQTYERSFGLTGPQALDPELHPLELQDRLSRLAAAIKQYQKIKAQRETQAAANQ